MREISFQKVRRVENKEVNKRVQYLWCQYKKVQNESDSPYLSFCAQYSVLISVQILLMVFSTDQHLRIMARARTTVSADGTLKVYHKLWYQLFIMNAEVAQSIWIPVVYAYTGISILPSSHLDSHFFATSGLKPPRLNSTFWKLN